MKKLTIVTLISCLSFFSRAQEVVATSGDFYTNSTAQLSWTLGEVMTESYLGTANHLTQGQQQTMYNPILSIEKNVSSKFQAYPNPTQSTFTLVTDGGDYQLDIKDSRGSEVKSIDVDTQSSEVDLNSFERGVYYVYIYDKNKQFIQNFKIVKL